jgi:hypothetical protein
MKSSDAFPKGGIQNIENAKNEEVLPHQGIRTDKRSSTVCHRSWQLAAFLSAPGLKVRRHALMISRAEYGPSSRHIKALLDLQSFILLI